jgi:hypothetical protein
MLRITVEDTDGSACVRVEGSLTQPWAEELEKCWSSVSAGTPRHKHVEVDLTELTDIDVIGKEILKEMHNSGVTLVGSGVMTRAVIKEISGSD